MTDRFNFSYRPYTTKIVHDNGWGSLTTNVINRSVIGYYHAKSPIVSSDYFQPTRYSAVTAKVKLGQFKARQWGSGSNAWSQTESGQYGKDPTSYALGNDLGSVNFNLQGYVSVNVAAQRHYDPLLIDLLAKVANVNFDALTALAESRKTAESFTTLSQTMLKHLRAVKKLDFKKLKSLNKSVSKDKKLPRRVRKKAKIASRGHTGTIDGVDEAWLFYRYGVMPSVYDVQAAIDGLDGTVVRDIYKDFKGGQQFDVDTIEETQLNGYTITDGHVGKAIAYLHLTGNVNSPLWATSSEVGLAQPFSTAWELMPWSFMVDWALPIGDWIKALSAIPNVTFTRISKSVKHEVTYMYDYVDTHGYTESRSYSVKYDAYGRAVVNNIWVPLPRLQNPFKGLVGAKRVTDIMSLISTISKK